MKLAKSQSLKSLTLVVITLVLSISCSDLELTTSPNTPPSSLGGSIGGPISPPLPGSSYNLTQWRTKASSLVNYNLSESGEYMGKVFDTHAYMNIGRLSRQNISVLNADFKIPGLDISAFASQLTSNMPTLIDDGTPINIAAMQPTITTFFNTTQVNFLNSYFTSMLSVTNRFQVFNTYSDTKQAVDNSRLSREQKIAVMAIVEMGHSFAMEHSRGGADGIFSDINTTIYGLASAPQGCNIRFRDVWRDAVWTGFSGAVAAGTYGALGGTIALPFLGTATGAVGGAVFGFAAGFVSGAAHSIAQQYFWKCLMKSPTLAPGSPCDDPYFALRNLDYCNIGPTVDRTKWYLLNN